MIMPSNKNKKAKFSRVLDIALVAAFCVTVVFLILLSVKINKGVAKTVETPKHLIRLQVVYSNNLQDKSGELLKRIETYRDNDMELKIVDRDVFKIRPIEKTFIISRNEDISKAEILAKKLNLNDDNILYQPLENNYEQIAVTLVLGEDFESIMLPDELDKE